MDHELPSIRPLKGCLIVLAAVVLCVGSVSATFDARCMSTFNTNLPRHPEAQMVQEFYPFLGTKFLYVYVPYDPVTVQTWYSQRTHVAKRNDRLNGTYTACGMIASTGPIPPGMVAGAQHGRQTVQEPMSSSGWIARRVNLKISICSKN